MIGSDKDDGQLTIIFDDLSHCLDIASALNNAYLPENIFFITYGNSYVEHLN